MEPNGNNYKVVVEPQPEPKQIELEEPQLEPNWFELEKLQPGAAFKEAGEDPATVMMK